MIRTIGVCTGESDSQRNAQDYALEWARLFGARLRIVGVWSGRTSFDPGSEDSPETMIQAKMRQLKETFGASGVAVDDYYRGEGREQALKAAASENDLLVLGLDTTEHSASGTGVLTRSTADLEIIGTAECSVLAVRHAPQSIRKILVHYQIGLEGKQALRLAGAWGEKQNAAVIALSVQSDAAHAAVWTETATRYLKGYDLPAVHTRFASGDPESEGDLLNLAKEQEADALVIGAKPYGLLDRLLDRDVAVDVARITRLPLLVAR